MININKIGDILIVKGYVNGEEKELEVTGDESINRLFELLENSKTIEEINIEELEKENAELQSEINGLAKQVEYLSNNLNLDDIKNIAVDWESEEIYPRYAYVKHNNEYYKLIHPKRVFDTTPPNEDSVMYEKIGGVDESTGLQELTPSVTNLYKKDDIGTYNGHVFQSNYDNNGVTPNVGDQSPAWWTDLGTVEEYQGEING